MSKPIDRAELVAFLETLRELHRDVTTAIMLLNADSIENVIREIDDHWRPDPFDFKIGNFGITRIGGVDLLEPWKERKE